MSDVSIECVGLHRFLNLSRSTIIQKSSDERLLHPNAAPFGYFYCGRNSAEPQRSDPTEVLRAILKQFICCDPSWLTNSTTAKEYKIRKREADEDGLVVAKLDIDETIEKIIDITGTTPATIFIDALDECRPTDRHKLLNALEAILNRSQHLVKILVSSRDDMDIVLKLQKQPNIYISIRDNREDINKFITAEISKAVDSGRLLNGQVSSQLYNLIARFLILKAHGM